MKVLVVTVLVSLSYLVSADRILVVIPMPGRSHHILAEPLAINLAKKGHHVTMLSPFPSGISNKNYTEIYFDGLLEYKEREMKEMMSFNQSFWKSLTSFGKVGEMAAEMMKSKALNDLIHSDATFDLIIYDLMMVDVIVGLGYHFKAPVIGLSSMGTTEISNLMVGNEAPFSYVPSLFLPFSDEMSFFERVLNTLIGNLFFSLTHCFLWPLHDRLLHETFPDAPPLIDLIHNISLILFNTHYSLESPRPYMPNMIQVGGLHIEDEKLPKDLKLFLDAAEEGVVLFSLGSNLKSSDLPAEKLETILKTLSKFPVKFLWKFEKDNFAVPKNLKISKWIPQRAVLAHPNTKAFITHGGLLSTTEAVHFGVPFIGIPGFGDQKSNVARAVRKEYALQLDMNNLNEDDFTNTLNEILNNPKYRNNIKKLSSLIRGQPLSPMETAVFWVEHVLKHKGAPHLQNAGLKLKWYQYHLIDVAAFLFAVLSVILWINYYIFKKTVRFIARKIFGSPKVKTN